MFNVENIIILSLDTIIHNIIMVWLSKVLDVSTERLFIAIFIANRSIVGELGHAQTCTENDLWRCSGANTRAIIIHFLESLTVIAWIVWRVAILEILRKRLTDMQG